MEELNNNLEEIMEVVEEPVEVVTDLIEDSVKKINGTGIMTVAGIVAIGCIAYGFKKIRDKKKSKHIAGEANVDIKIDVDNVNEAE